MSKAKEEFEKLNVNKESKNMVYVTCVNYIERLQKENEYLRLLFTGINKHVVLLEQLTGAELDILFDKLEDK